mmetsp:Transcript_27995/g.65397  ORF Transcript_27995/g.65397 Transcript_27995/m.65397 type:complete len:215 (-) Transcript_27995:760-1404(-)
MRFNCTWRSIRRYVCCLRVRMLRSARASVLWSAASQSRLATPSSVATMHPTHGGARRCATRATGRSSCTTWGATTSGMSGWTLRRLISSASTRRTTRAQLSIRTNWRRASPTRSCSTSTGRSDGNKMRAGSSLLSRSRSWESGAAHARCTSPMAARSWSIRALLAAAPSACRKTTASPGPTSSTASQRCVSTSALSPTASRVREATWLSATRTL